MRQVGWGGGWTAWRATCTYSGMDADRDKDDDDGEQGCAVAQLFVGATAAAEAVLALSLFVSLFFRLLYARCANQR